MYLCRTTTASTTGERETNVCVSDKFDNKNKLYDANETNCVVLFWQHVVCCMPMQRQSELCRPTKQHKTSSRNTRNLLWIVETRYMQLISTINVTIWSKNEGNGCIHVDAVKSTKQMIRLKKALRRRAISWCCFPLFLTWRTFVSVWKVKGCQSSDGVEEKHGRTEDKKINWLHNPFTIASAFQYRISILSIKMLFTVHCSPMDSSSFSIIALTIVVHWRDRHAVSSRSTLSISIRTSMASSLKKNLLYISSDYVSKHHLRNVSWLYPHKPWPMMSSFRMNRFTELWIQTRGSIYFATLLRIRSVHINVISHYSFGTMYWLPIRLLLHFC